jgi:hypothetical protein
MAKKQRQSHGPRRGGEQTRRGQKKNPPEMSGSGLRDSV